ncbi:MAG: helix-turn-helix domain-containing protein [Thalassolituus sp.]
MREKQALTTGEVAKYCGVNFRTVIRWIERGHLDAYKLPGRGDNRIPVESFVDFLNNNNMPVPDELGTGGHKLVLLADVDELSTEIASCVRRAGWDLLVTQDPVHFGFLVSQNQPAAIAVTRTEYEDSVRRIMRDADSKDMLCVSISTATDTVNGLKDGWLHIRWPQDQQQFILQLTSNVAA